MQIKINPNILGWARQEAGCKIDEISQLLDISEDRYRQWEKSGDGIPLSHLRQIAKKYKRQMAIFLLPEVPPKAKKPSDFRNLKLSSREYSSELLLAIRRARRYLKLALQLKTLDYWKNQYQWLNEAKNPDALRRLLKISIKQQKAYKNKEDSFRAWRTSIENELKIFVFKFPLPKNEIQAFCICDNEPYGIVVNSNNYPQVRSFSLFHEVAHIANKRTAVCYPDEINEDQHEEYACNKYAGKVLLPDEDVPIADDLDKLKYYANLFKVSKDVVLRRSYEQGKISNQLFFNLLDELRSLPKLEEKPFGRATQIVKCKSSRGELFFDLIINAAKNNTISYNTASDVLSLKMNYLLYV